MDIDSISETQAHAICNMLARRLGFETVEFIYVNYASNRAVLASSKFNGHGTVYATPWKRYCISRRELNPYKCFLKELLLNHQYWYAPAIYINNDTHKPVIITEQTCLCSSDDTIETLLIELDLAS